MKRLPVLPCYPCPHSNACCSKGTNLRDDEAADIADRYGPDTVVLLTALELQARFAPNEPLEVSTYWNRGEPEWCTALTERGCVFLAEDGACRIYLEPFFPEICRMYPWSGLGHPDMAGDADLCPEPKG